MAAMGGDRDEPVGGGREMVSTETIRKKRKTSSQCHRELVQLDTLLSLPLHGSPLGM